tara:strand:+ start:266 stop:547 length:282 start_codon:yes stop_codon:yes gene_type:complete
MKNLNFHRENNELTKTEMRKLLEVEKKKFFKNGGVVTVLKAHTGPETPSCFTKEWEQPVVIGIPAEIDNMYKQVTGDTSNFLNEKYANNIKDY